MPAHAQAGSVLLLGGSGFVGSRLAARLAAADLRVLVPTRNPARARALTVAPRIEVVAADVHDERTLAALMRGNDAVVNLVGILNERGHAGAGFERAHTELADKIVRAAHATGVTRLLQMSALKADPERAPSHYLRTKGRAERAVIASGLGYTIFRPSAIFGPGDSFLNRFAALLRALPVLPLPGADARFAPVFVDDVAAAFARALADPATRGATFELCGPDIYSLEEIVRLIARELGVKRAIVPLPPAIGRLAAWVGEYLLPGKPLSLDNFASLGVASVCAEDGLERLGIRPRSLEAVAALQLRPGRQQRRLARFRGRARRG